MVYGQLQDVESGRHEDASARLQVLTQENWGHDFIFRQYQLGVLSHYSYLIGSQGIALIVDPTRDIQVYLQEAQALKLEIKYVYLTHSHADFVAGHLELAKATGATILMHPLSQPLFAYQAMENNAEVEFGSVRAIVKLTPGHTPDGTCLYVHFPKYAENPKWVLTGDTLFVGSVGRPDLLGESVSAVSLAGQMYESWNNVLSKLPDETLIFPAHGAGSLCGVHISDSPFSTIQEEKRNNFYLQQKNKMDFIAAVLDGLPESPAYFKHNAQLNRTGPPLIQWDREISALTPSEVQEKEHSGAWLIDIREPEAFAENHVAGSVHIGLRGRFENWVGTILPWGTPFVLIGSNEEVKEAVTRLTRVGYDEPLGYLNGGVDAWKQAGLPVQNLMLLAPQMLSQQIQEGKAPLLVDVRLPTEWQALRIHLHLVNLPLHHLYQESTRLDPEMPVVTICNSAYRSSMAASLLQKKGFQQVYNLSGGSEAWIEAKLPTYGTEMIQTSTTETAVVAPQKEMYQNIPERIAPEELAQRLMELPDSLEVLDIRPAWQFMEYHLASAKNSTVEELLKNIALSTETRPLVLICRDGSLSAVISGMLSQKTNRPLKFLSGGMLRYFNEIVIPGERGKMKSIETVVPSKIPEVQAVPPVKTVTPKKKTAGC